MQNNNIFIPTKCKVGFNKRNDTYTGYLGYIIYQKGKEWKQEKSWEGWREKYLSEEEFQEMKLKEFNKQVINSTRYYDDWKLKKDDYSIHRIREFPTLESYLERMGLKSLEEYNFYSHKIRTDEKLKPIEFDNVPLEGFTLNKKVGGTNSGWNHRNTYARVFHPLGFEFEISVENLLYILENTNCVGKAFEGKCVLGWECKNLVLIPENAPEYQGMQVFTQLQSKSIKTKDLVEGYTYQLKNKDFVVYLGKFDYWDKKYVQKYRTDWTGREIPDGYYYEDISKLKHWFYNTTKKEYYQCTSLSNVAQVTDQSIDSNFADYREEIEHLSSFSPIDDSKAEYVKIENVEELKKNYNDLYIFEHSKYVRVEHYHWNKRFIRYSDYYHSNKNFLSLIEGKDCYESIIELGVYTQVKYLKNDKKYKGQ